MHAHRKDRRRALGEKAAPSGFTPRVTFGRMPPRPLSLVAILEQVQVGLRNPANHYLVTTNYFETEQGPFLLGTVHLQADTVWDLVIGPDAFTSQVLLTPHECHPIRGPFANVWQLLHGNSPRFNAGNAAVLYKNDQVLARFARGACPSKKPE